MASYLRHLSGHESGTGTSQRCQLDWTGRGAPEQAGRSGLIDDIECEVPTLNSLTKSFVGHAVDLDKELNQHPPTRHTFDIAMVWWFVVPRARPGREQLHRNNTSTFRNGSGQVGKGR